MKVELTKEGRFSLTAENEQDNTMLFAVINTPTLNGIRFTFPTGAVKVQTPKLNLGVADTEKPKRAYRRKQYIKQCQVEGCNEKHKVLSLHMYKKHGVAADGTMHDTYVQAGQTRRVAKPVVKLGNGTYKLRPEAPAERKPSFLD